MRNVIGWWFLCSSALLWAAEIPEQNCFTIPLWPQTVPGALGSEPKDIPEISVYLPAGGVGSVPVVVICPGGGYVRLAAEHEGREIAERLRQQQVAGIVLKYRLPVDGYRHPIPLLDARRAIQIVRLHADEWKINREKIGILGFSAGGHLASTAGTFFEEIPLAATVQDAASQMAYRPDFMVLVYPVISMRDDITHGGSKGNLLGPQPPQELVERLSNERQITSQTPPTFLIHANDDTGVPPENSILFYEGLRKAGIPAELHIYLKGGHGFGIRPSAGPACGWLDACLVWMEQMGLRDKPAAKSKK